MSAPPIDQAVFTELQETAGAEFVVELVDTFIEEAPSMLAEMRAASAAGAVDRFRRAAHSLKSNAHTFGATALATQALALEVDGLPVGTRGIDAVDAEFARVAVALKELARG
jgi:HPt (histidine-containing phosphotransfer) domain-containing protein